MNQQFNYNNAKPDVGNYLHYNDKSGYRGSGKVVQEATRKYYTDGKVIILENEWTEDDNWCRMKD